MFLLSCQNPGPGAVQVHIFCCIFTCLPNISDLCFSSFSFHNDSLPKRRFPNLFLETSLISYSLPSKQTILVRSWLPSAAGCRYMVVQVLEPQDLPHVTILLVTAHLNFLYSEYKVFEITVLT